MHSRCMVTADVTEVPGLIGDAGDLGLVSGIAKDKTEFLGVCREPFSCLGIAKRSVGGT